MRSLHSQAATVDLFAGVVPVLSHVVTTATAYGLVALRISGLAAAAETTLTVAITIDGEPVGGTDLTETVQAGRTILRKPIDGIEVAVGETLAIVVTSDQAADTAVAVTATLRDGSPMQPATRGRQLLVDAEGDTTTGTTTEVADAVHALIADSVIGAPNIITVDVFDDSTAAKIENARARLYRTGVTTKPKLTDADGAAQFGVQSATWSIVITAEGYESLITSVVVDGDATIECPLSAFAIPLPAAEGLCVVYAWIKTNGTPIDGATLQANLRSQNSAAAGVLLSTAVDSGTTDATGYVALQLVQAEQFTDGDGLYVITARDGDKVIWSIEATIPTQNSINVSELLG